MDKSVKLWEGMCRKDRLVIDYVGKMREQGVQAIICPSAYTPATVKVRCLKGTV